MWPLDGKTSYDAPRSVIQECERNRLEELGPEKKHTDRFRSP